MRKMKKTWLYTILAMYTAVEEYNKISENMSCLSIESYYPS